MATCRAKLTLNRPGRIAAVERRSWAWHVSGVVKLWACGHSLNPADEMFPARVRCDYSTPSVQILLRYGSWSESVGLVRDSRIYLNLMTPFRNVCPSSRQSTFP